MSDCQRWFPFVAPTHADLCQRLPPKKISSCSSSMQIDQVPACSRKYHWLLGSRGGSPIASAVPHLLSVTMFRGQHKKSTFSLMSIHSTRLFIWLNPFFLVLWLALLVGFQPLLLRWPSMWCSISPSTLPGASAWELDDFLLEGKSWGCSRPCLFQWGIHHLWFFWVYYTVCFVIFGLVPLQE